MYGEVVARETQRLRRRSPDNCSPTRLKTMRKRKHSGWDASSKRASLFALNIFMPGDWTFMGTGAE